MRTPRRLLNHPLTPHTLPPPLLMSQPPQLEYRRILGTSSLIMILPSAYSARIAITLPTRSPVPILDFARRDESTAARCEAVYSVGGRPFGGFGLEVLKLLAREGLLGGFDGYGPGAAARRV
jgi:hypothetical protein